MIVWRKDSIIAIKEEKEKVSELERKNAALEQELAELRAAIERGLAQ